MQSCAQVIRQVRLRLAGRLETFVLGSQVEIYLNLVAKIIRNRSVDLLKTERRKVVENRFWGIAVEEAVHDRVQGHTGIPDEVVRLPPPRSPQS